MSRVVLILACLCGVMSSLIYGSAGAWATDLPLLLSNDTPLGAGFGVQIKEMTTASEDLDDIRDMGAQYLRFGFVWTTIESPKGQYNWPYADLFMRKINSRNLYAIYEVGAFNGDYSPLVDTEPNKPNDQGQQEPEAPVQPAALKAMESFIAETVQRYHGDHIVWEIWNEPDMNSNWPPRSDAVQYARVMGETCATIKYIDPHAVVIGPALAYLPSHDDHENFLATVLQSSASRCLDAISVHPYRHRDQPPESVSKDYEELRVYITEHTPRGQKVLPIVNSEWGYSLAEVTPEQQAAYIIRSFIITRLSGIPISNWYEYRDSLPDDQTEIGKMDREAHFGLRDYDDNDKLSAKVVNAIIPQLAQSYVDKKLILNDNKIYVLLLHTANGGHQVMFWLADKVNADHPGIMIADAGSRRTYPVNLIPTLLCTSTAADVSLILGPVNEDQKYYVPCP